MYKPIEVRYDKEFDYGCKDIDANWEQLNKQDKEARGKGELKGRYITHPFADGQAVYEIIRENKKTVRIRVCTGLGDDWVLPAWGEETTINKDYALDYLKFRDYKDGLFKKNKK